MSLKAKALLKTAKKQNRFADAVQAAVDGLFPQQLAVFKDPAKRVLLRPGRRSGKTYTTQTLAAMAAEKFPKSIIPVCELATTTTAANNFWKELIAFSERNDLGFTFRHTAKEAITPNGSTIRLFGVSTADLADKLRGEPYPVVIIDEAGTYRPKILEYLVEDVLTPSMIDYDGTIYMAGTPGLVKKGYWYEACMGDEWSKHFWTLLDNPELGKQAYQRTREWRAQWLANYILSKGWLDKAHWADKDPEDVIKACQHARFLREYMAQWVDGTGEAMYELGPRNIIGALPEADPRKPWRYGLSIDMGFDDPAAFFVSATRKDDPYVYGVYSRAESKLIPSAIAAEVDRLQHFYGRFAFIVADTGGGGKMGVEEMIQKYGLPITAAQKAGKRVFVEHINGDLRTGRIQIVERQNNDLIEDLYTLPWNEDHTDAEENYADHLPDAFLYGCREWMHRAGGWDLERKPVEEGSAEWLKLQDEADERHADQLAKKERERIMLESDPWADLAAEEDLW